MASSSPVSGPPFHIRSISMPSGYHPLAIRVEEELQKLRTCMASPTSHQMMCNGLQGLGDLYDCMEEFLHMPHNQQSCYHRHQKKQVEAELDGSIRLLDLCSAMRDSLSSAKEHVIDLQSTLRRNDAAIESKMHAYIRSRKKAEKGIKSCFASLKQMDCNFSKDGDLSLLIEAREITISLLLSISSFMSTPRSQQKASRWSLVSKALQKRKVECEDGNGEGALAASFYAFYECLSCKDVNGGRVQKVQHELQTMVSSIEVLENGLECLFRRLIQNRVSLLNILSL